MDFSVAFFKTHKSGKREQMERQVAALASLASQGRFSPTSEPHSRTFGPDKERKTAPTMYQTPRMMVPVRTWQHRQQLVEYHRSHGEIILATV